jgi:hypothetical protein
LNGGRVALVARHHVDLVDLHLAVEPRLGLALNQALAKLFGHGLDVALAEIEFLGDLPVRQVETHEVQAQNPDPQRLMMAGQHRAGQVVETRLAELAQPALARGPVVIPAIADHVAAATRRALHTVRPALPTDQVEALGIIEQTGQADQVVGHETFAAIGGIVPQLTKQVRIPLTLKHPGRLLRTALPSP